MKKNISIVIKKPVLAIALLVHATILVAVFIALTAKHKSVSKALLAIAAIEGGVGLYLLTGDTLKEKTKSYLDFFDADDFDLFSETEADLAEDIIYNDLRGDAEPTDVKSTYTIPTDDEASEKDFEV